MPTCYNAEEKHEIAETLKLCHKKSLDLETYKRFYQESNQGFSPEWYQNKYVIGALVVLAGAGGYYVGTQK